MYYKQRFWASTYLLIQEIQNEALQMLWKHLGLRRLHWLKVPERIEFKLAVLIYKFLHQTAPPYLAEELHPSSADEARQRLRSASTSSLVVRHTRVSTIGDRAFPVAAARLWNTVPLNATSASSISVFILRPISSVNLSPNLL